MIRFIPATDRDMYDVADIRNTGRDFMTHHTDYITSQEQYDWWMSKDDNLYKIWLVMDENDIILGFCMLRTMPEGKVWGTLAVYPEWQGIGIGTAIYRFMTEQTAEVWIEVRNDNIASLRAAVKVGFIIYHSNEHITTLVYR